MIKKIVILFLLNINICFSQANYIISPDVISSSGGDFSNFNYNLSFTIGEISTETLQASNAILTQGFHQDYINVTSISEDMFTNNVKVYPNPTNDHLFVTFDNIDSVNIKLTDYTGKVVLKKQNYLINYEPYIDLSFLPSGLYLLSLNFNDKYNSVFKINKIN
tara:strand:- start:13291 stop:13779 length:489 start_codon:yes stop_codon:yes gene_type:complete